MSDKPTLLLIHGWAMSPAVWGDFAEALAPHFDLHLLPLPGHGGSPAIPGWTAEALAEHWLERWPNALWLGWSLGAQVALAAVSRPGSTARGAILLAGTPRFVAAPDWGCAMPRRRFEVFRTACEEAPAETLQQFMGMQVIESEEARKTLQTLRERVQQAPSVDGPALLAALEVLGATDLRPDLVAVRVPTLWIGGDEDRLVPISAAETASRQLAASTVECLPGAGHAPFISHQQDVAERIVQWVRDMHRKEHFSREQGVKDQNFEGQSFEDRSLKDGQP